MVNAVRYAPDGRTLVTAGNDGTIRQWDAGSGRQLQVIADAGYDHLVAVSPDGKALASAARDRAKPPVIRVWDLPGGRLRREFSGPAKVAGTKALAFSPDGNLVLAYSSQLGLKIFDIATGDERQATQPHFMLQSEKQADINLASGAFGPGNRYLALCTFAATHVVELASGEERFSCPGYQMTFAFTPGGEGLAVASAADPYAGSRGINTVANASVLEVVDIATGRRKRIFVPTERVAALTFSPDGRALAVSAGWRDSSIRLYGVEDGREIDSWACPATRTHPGAMAFAPDCRSVAVGLDDTTVVVWKLNLRSSIAPRSNVSFTTSPSGG